MSSETVSFGRTAFPTAGKAFLESGILFHFRQSVSDAFRLLPVFRPFRFLIAAFKFGIMFFPCDAGFRISLADFPVSTPISSLVFRDEFLLGNLG